MPLFDIPPISLLKFLSLDSCPWGSKTTFPAGCVIPALWHSKKSKMAAAVVADAGKV